MFQLVGHLLTHCGVDVIAAVDSLTAEERKRNVPGDMLVYEHAAGRHEPDHCDTTLPQHFGSVAHAHSTCRRVPPPDPIPATDRGFVPALAKGTSTGKKNPPGFPTLKTMSVRVQSVGRAAERVIAIVNGDTYTTYKLQSRCSLDALHLILQSIAVGFCPVSLAGAGSAVVVKQHLPSQRMWQLALLAAISCCVASPVLTAEACCRVEDGRRERVCSPFQEGFPHPAAA